MDDSYKEVSARELAEIKIKGSRFIGEVVPASSIEDAEAALGQIRKREYNATHHCWAYRLGVKGDLFRYSDDGEPSGTAGQPILRHIDGLGITNILVVVTRYYGGTKLGTGGLIRAYGEAARLVLEKSVIEEKILRDESEHPFCVWGHVCSNAYDRQIRCRNSQY